MIDVKKVFKKFAGSFKKIKPFNQVKEEMKNQFTIDFLKNCSKALIQKLIIKIDEISKLGKLIIIVFLIMTLYLVVNKEYGFIKKSSVDLIIMIFITCCFMFFFDRLMTYFLSSGSYIETIVYYSINLALISLSLVAAMYSVNNDFRSDLFYLTFTMLISTFVTIFTMKLLRNKKATFLITLLAIIGIVGFMLVFIGIMFGGFYLKNIKFYNLSNIDGSAQVNNFLIQILYISSQGIQPFLSNIDDGLIREVEFSSINYLVLIPYLEQIFGFFYISLVIGYLVGMLPNLKDNQRKSNLNDIT